MIPVHHIQPPPPQQPPQPIVSYKRDTIPGLDFDDDDYRRRKVNKKKINIFNKYLQAFLYFVTKKAPYAKPIPKEFEKAWKSNKPLPSTATSIKTDMDSASHSK